MSSPSKCIVVVRRGETGVFERLQAAVAGLADAELIWDRRVRDRRVIIQDMDADRRRGERRAPVDATMWTTRGYIVTRPQASPGEVAVPEAAAEPARRASRLGHGSAGA